MKLLISIGVIILIVAGIFAIVPAFIDEDITFSRTTDINKPVDVVFGVVKNFEYYKEWSAWSRMDLDAKNELTGTPGEVGSKWSWDGDTVGVGSLTIEELVPNKSIKNRLDFLTPRPMTALDLWNFESVDSTTTTVKWTYSGAIDSYFGRYMNLAMEDMLAPHLEAGLSNLKELIENLPEPQPKKIEDTVEN